MRLIVTDDTGGYIVFERGGKGRISRVEDLLAPTIEGLDKLHKNMSERVDETRDEKYGVFRTLKAPQRALTSNR